MGTVPGFPCKTRLGFSRPVSFYCAGRAIFVATGGFMNMDEAIKACKNGATAAFISGTMTTLLVATAMLRDTSDELALWNDPTNLVDIVLIFGCAFGMLKYSRTAAVSIFVYFIISKTAITLETGQTSGLVMSFVFLYFFARAIQGSFAYKKLRKAEDPEFRAAPRWVYWMSLPTMTLFFVAAGYGVLTMTDMFPSTEVLDGEAVSAADMRQLIESGIIYDDEEIEYLFSYGVRSILEGGSVLSDRAVIMYYTDEDDGFNVYEITFDQIASIQLIEEGDMWTDSVYQVNGFDADNWLTIALSDEGDGDEKFITALKRRIPTQAVNIATE
jgi:hypothetical protein